MAIPKALDRIMRSYTATLRPSLGKGAGGEQFGPPVTFPCYAEPARSRTRSSESEASGATAKIWTFLDSPGKVGDRIEVGDWSGELLTVNEFSSRGAARTPDHVEMTLG